MSLTSSPGLYTAFSVCHVFNTDFLICEELRRHYVQS